MGQLRNTLRHTVDGEPHLTGLIPIGDARCHTNPTFAFGLALGISHAVALGPAIASAANDPELIMAYEAAVGADAAARYEAVSAEDRDRVRLWSGEPIDPTNRRDTIPLFLRSVVYRAATLDATLLRAVCRRINLLDPIDALPANQELLDRGETLFRELPAITPIPRETIDAALRDTA
jgi:2-polyprenyl-6-methoxyphenol hydroxylase-like FAD-dependent oxidoreductase